MHGFESNDCSCSRALPAAADGKRAAPACAEANDAGSLSSQDGHEDGDVAVRLLSPAVEAPVDEEFEADFAALMDAHQAGVCQLRTVLTRCDSAHASVPCQILLQMP